MNRTGVTRRRALRVLGGAATVAGGILAGLLPENDALASVPTSFADIAKGRRLMLRQRTARATREARAAATLASPGGGVVRAFLARRGFAPVHETSESADVLWSDGELIGTIDSVTFHDLTSGQYAQVIRQLGKARTVLGVVIWSGSRPLVREVYDVRGGDITFSATVSRADDGAITVRALDGTTDVIAPRSGAGKRGAASLYCTSVCTWECTFVCRWVCTTVLFTTCVISTLCGPLVIVCAGACIVAAYVSCQFNCENVCSLSCQYWCYVLEDSAP